MRTRNREFRDDVLPGARGDGIERVFVGGSTPMSIDTTEDITSSLPRRPRASHRSGGDHGGRLPGWTDGSRSRTSRARPRSP